MTTSYFQGINLNDRPNRIVAPDAYTSSGVHLTPVRSDADALCLTTNASDLCGRVLSDLLPSIGSLWHKATVRPVSSWEGTAFSLTGQLVFERVASLPPGVVLLVVPITDAFCFPFIDIFVEAADALGDGMRVRHMENFARGVDTDGQVLNFFLVEYGRPRVASKKARKRGKR